MGVGRTAPEPRTTERPGVTWPNDDNGDIAKRFPAAMIVVDQRSLASLRAAPMLVLPRRIENRFDVTIERPQEVQLKLLKK